MSVDAIERFIDDDLAGSAVSSPLMSDFVDNLNAHREFEVAIGVLMGLRGCAQSEALSEISTAAQEMRIDAAELGRALVSLASGKDTSPHHSVVADRWRHLLALRGSTKHVNPAESGRPVRVRYGPENRSVIC